FASTLSAMLTQATISSPFIQTAFNLIGASVSGLKSPLDTMKEKFNLTMVALKNSVSLYLNPIVAAIDAVRNAWNNLKNSLFNSKTPAQETSTSDQASGSSSGAIATGATVAAGTAL